MKYIIYNDLHLFGVDPLNIVIESGANVILNGDIVDRVNCKKTEVGNANKLFLDLMTTFKARYVTGNHEAVMTNREFVINKILFIHGDYLFWNKEAADKFRSQSPGASWFKRIFISGIIAKIRRKYRNLDEDVISKAILMMRVMDCKTMVLGHKHYDKIMNTNCGDYRIIVLPRGRNEIDL